MAAHTNSSEDKRIAPRIPITLPVQVADRKARTRDVSLSGVYFETDQSFEPGSKLHFSVDLRHVNPDGVLRLVCEGTIVRVEQEDGKLGVAVAITSHQLQVVEGNKPGVAVVIGSDRLKLVEYMQ